MTPLQSGVRMPRTWPRPLSRGRPVVVNAVPQPSLARRRPVALVEQAGPPLKRVALVTNIPAPYRLPVWERVAAQAGIELCVFFCSEREPDRLWDLRRASFRTVFLKEQVFTVKGRFIHANPDVWPALDAFAPDVIITTGFNPTHLLAFLYAWRKRLPHIAQTDGTYESERTLSGVHRLVRRFVFNRTRAFVGASAGSMKLYESYGIEASKRYQSHLCTDNAAFAPNLLAPAKRYDLLFCGRFVDIKNPLFALDVAQAVARRLGRRISIAFVGSGPMEAAMRRAAAAMPEVEAAFPGFMRQADLPRQYQQARLFLFPSSWDPWGVVANEACAAGLPVIASPAAGAAGELVRDGVNGRVLCIEVQSWAEAAAELLSNQQLYFSYAQRSQELVQDYNYSNAAQGLVDAVKASTAPTRAAEKKKSSSFSAA